MGEGQPWVLIRAAFLLADLSSYGLKEWLAILASVLGLGGSVFGLWRGFRYSKTQIANRLMEYLHDEEAKIKASRDRIIRHLRLGAPIGENFEHESFQGMQAALADQAANDIQSAEKTLNNVAQGLRHDVGVGEKFAANANLQLATALLIRGKSAFTRGEHSAARLAWEQALQCYSSDAEVQRYLGELSLAAGDIQPALEHFNRAQTLSQDDKLLHAETWEQVADYYRDQGPMRSELKALREAAPNYAEAERGDRAAGLYMRAGELGARLGHTREAPEHFRAAFDIFSARSDRAGMAAARANLEALGEDVTDLSMPSAPHGRRLDWRWIRYAVELAVLVAAAGLFYFSLR